MLEFLGHRVRILVVLILLVTLLGIILFLNKILFPFLLACFLAYVLAPLIDYLHQRKIRTYSISRGLAVLMVYLVILFVLIGGGSYVVPNVSAEMVHMIQELPKAVTKISKEWGPIFDEKFPKSDRQEVVLGVRIRSMRATTLVRSMRATFNVPAQDGSS